MFFVVSVAYIIYFFGLGYLVANPLLPQDDNLPLMEKIPFFLTSGFLVNYLIILLVQSLTFGLFIGGVISGCSLIWFFMRRGGQIVFDRYRKWFPTVAIAVILLLYYITILCDPLWMWDARSIWFFHAKMIWSAESLNMAAGWDHPSIQWSHVDYPKLIAVTAAQVSYSLGYWNEYAPKVSLFLILIPLIFWIFSFYSHRFSFLFLVLVFPFGLKSYLWNGLMDGYLAFYSAISMLLLGRYFKERRLVDLMSAVSCLILLSNIKNEGILIGLIGIVSIAVTAIFPSPFKLIEFKKFFRIYQMGWLAVIISPGILWTVFCKYKWGLINDLQLGTTDGFLRMMNRFSDGTSFPLILKRTFFHDESAVWLALGSFIVSLIILSLAKRHTISWIPALFTAIVYYWCIVIIYLSTPRDLNWHIATSIPRVMLTVSSCTIAGTFFILKELEEASIERSHSKFINSTDS